MPSWQRVRAANLLASNGSAWVDTFKRHNSGTYNNQVGRDGEAAAARLSVSVWCIGLWHCQHAYDPCMHAAQGKNLFRHLKKVTGTACFDPLVPLSHTSVVVHQTAVSRALNRA